MEHEELEKRATAAMPMTASPDSEESEGQRRRLPSVPTEAWEERIDDHTTVLWTCRDPGARRVIKIINRTPLLRKQQAAGIPPAYRAARLASWDESKSNPYTSDIVRCYVHQPSHSLFLTGRVGTGKSWAMCCIGNELLEKGRSVKFQSVSGLLLAIRDTFAYDSSSELQILEPFFSPEFLLLDEMGDVCLDGDRKASGFAASRILLLLDRRSQAGGATVITSNLDLEKLTEWVGDERISSRIRGLCGAGGIIGLEGRDLRFDEVPEEIGA